MPPSPNSHFHAVAWPTRLIGKRNKAAVHVDDFVRPPRLKLRGHRLQGHQPESDELIGIAEKRLLVREIPESHASFRVHVVVVDEAPRQPDELVLGELRFNRALRPIAARVIERRDPELEDKLSRRARLEVVVVRGVRVGRSFVPARSPTPSSSPCRLAA